VEAERGACAASSRRARDGARRGWARCCRASKSRWLAGQVGAGALQGRAGRRCASGRCWGGLELLRPSCCVVWAKEERAGAVVLLLAQGLHIGAWGGGKELERGGGLASWAGREALPWGTVPAWQGKLWRRVMRERAGDDRGNAEQGEDASKEQCGLWAGFSWSMGRL
jgi:hypothetical protein